MTARKLCHRIPATPAPTGWHDRAACCFADLGLFFPSRSKPAEPARQVWARYPVREPYLGYASSNGIVHGI
jgi:hypothetical protein